MTLAQLIVVLVALQRLAELFYARHNARQLRRLGAIEHGARQYPLMIALHGSWLVALFFWPAAEISLPFLGLFGVLQLLRLWVIVTLGRHWTTRVLVLPGGPLVRSGPYRYLRHPNYLVVAAEIAVLPLALGAWELAVGYSVLNAIVLGLRIRVEGRALRPAVSAAGRE